MTGYLLGVLALGLAGLDLLAVAVLMALLALGAAPRRAALVFTAACALGTLVPGVLLAVLGRPLVQRVATLVGAAPGTGLGAALLAVVAAVLLGWAVIRHRRGHPAPEVPAALRDLVPTVPGTARVAVVGAVVGLGALGDAAFLAAAFLAATRPDAAQAAAGVALFFALSQAPLLLVTTAAVAGRGEAVARHRRQWTSGTAGRALTALLLAGALVALAAAVVASAR